MLASNVLEHFEPDIAAGSSADVREVLKPGGRFIIIQPNFRYAFRSYFDDYTHRSVFTDVSLPDLLRAHGFAIERVQPRFLPVLDARTCVPVVPGWLVRAYLRSPVKPLAGQMLIVARKRLSRCTGQNASASCCPPTTRSRTSARRSRISSSPAWSTRSSWSTTTRATAPPRRRPAPRARVVHETQQGYGHALRRGLREATGDLVILAEPDGTFIGRDVLKLLAYSDDFDMVCGTRTTRELIWAQANMGWFLRIGNWAVAKMISGALRRAVAERLRLHAAADAPQRRWTGSSDDLTVGGSHFLPEMVILGLKRGLRIIEVPVNYRGRVGESKITGSLKGTLRTGFRMIGLILRYRLS